MSGSPGAIAYVVVGATSRARSRAWRRGHPEGLMTRPLLSSRRRSPHAAAWTMIVALAAAGCRDGVAPPENVTPAAPLRGLGGTTTEKWQVAVIASTLCDQTWANSINDSDVVVG